MSFDIFARDFASRSIRNVGDEAERTSRKLDGLGRSGSALRGSLSGLGGALPGLGGGLQSLGGHITSTVGHLGQLGVSLVATGAKLAVLGTAAASAASSTASLAAALVPVGGLVAALPGVIAGGVAALTTMKLAFYGVGDAMKHAYEGDDKKFAEDLEKLTPAARDFANEFRNLVPAMKEWQAAAQTGFFRELNGSLGRFLDLLRDTQPWVEGLASTMGFLTRQVLEFATSASSVSSFNKILSDTSGTLTGLSQGLRPVLQGFLDLSVVGTGFMRGLSGEMGEALARFGEFLSRASASGQALQWMENGLTVLKALGSIAKDVGGILSGVFEALRTSSGGALGVVGQLVDRLNTWVNSTAGQDALVSVFKALDQAGRALFPVIEALAGAVALIAPRAAEVAAAFGPALANAVNALAPAVAALGPGLVAVGDALARAFANPAVGQALLALGTGLSNLLIAVSPLIPPLVELAALLVERFGNSLTLLATFLQPVTSALGDVLRPILPELAQLFRDASAALLPFAQQLGGELASALRDAHTVLGPVTDALREVGQEVLAKLREVLPQITPHLGELARAFTSVALEVVKLLPDLIRFAGDILVELIGQLPVLVPMIVDLAMAFLDIARQVTPLIPPLLRLLLEIVKPLIPELPKLLPPFIDLAWIFADLLAKATPMITKLLESPEALAVVKSLGENGALALKTLARALEVTLGACQTFLGVFFGMPGQVQAGLGRIGEAIRGWINDVIGWFEAVINNFASIVPGMSRVSLPRLANGAVVARQMLALIGEAGPEVVIPLTRPARALELAQQSGLFDVLARASTGSLARFSSIGASAAAALGAPRPSPTRVATGGNLTIINHFAGQPLVHEDDIIRMVVQAANQATARGFSLGVVKTV